MMRHSMIEFSIIKDSTSPDLGEPIPPMFPVPYLSKLGQAISELCEMYASSDCHEEAEVAKMYANLTAHVEQKVATSALARAERGDDPAGIAHALDVLRRIEIWLTYYGENLPTPLNA